MINYTNLEQSRILAEILPIKSADGTWEKYIIAGNNLNISEKEQYIHKEDCPFIFYSGIGVPSWSLISLLNIIPGSVLTKYEDNWNCATFDKDNHFKDECFSDNPVDACYKLILKLHEQKFNFKNI